MPEIDKDLLNTLKQAKGGKPMQFAFLAKGTGGKLLAAKKVMPAAINEAKKETGSTALFKGRLLGEDGHLVFEVAKEPPPTLAALLKRTIKEHAGLTADVIVRVKGDAEEEQPHETEQETPGQAPTQGVGREQVMARLQRLTPQVKAALTGPNAARVQALLGAANGLLKNSDFVQADKVLDELEPLVGTGAPPPSPDHGRAEVLKRLNALAPGIKAALAGPSAARVQTLFGAANGLLKNNDFAQAGKVLDELEPLVKAGGAPPSPGGDKAAVLKRLNALAPGIKAALAGPNAARVQTLFGAVNGLLKNNDFAQAGKVLDELEPLVGGAPPPGGDGASGKQAWERALALVQPRYVAVLKTDSPAASKLRAVMGFATGKAEAGEYDKALAALKQLEPLLGAAPGEGPGPVDAAAFQKSWAEARTELRAAVDTVGDQLAEFAGVLTETGEENLVWIAEEGLSQLFNALRTTALTIDRTTSKTPAKVVAKVKPAIADLRKQLQSSQVRACDENDNGVTVTIRESIGKAIQRLEAALAQAPPG